MNAFPELQSSGMNSQGDTCYTSAGGMSLRDYFAAEAMLGFLSNPSEFKSKDELAEKSYVLADAMMKVRES